MFNVIDNSKKLQMQMGKLNSDSELHSTTMEVFIAHSTTMNEWMKRKFIQRA